jgi:hypothetical protein
MRLIALMLMMLFLESCGGSTASEPVSTTNSNGRFVSNQTHTYAVNIDPSTLVELATVTSNYLTADEYSISSPGGQDLLNQDIDPSGPFASQRLSYNDLGAYDYFLAKDSQCPRYAETADHSYNNGILTINTNIFSLDSIACPALVGSNVYRVYRARKLL